MPGEKVKYINVTIIDNMVPELDKVFRVELYNPNGGGKKIQLIFLSVIHTDILQCV